MADDRDRQSMGTSRSLVATSPYQVNYSGRMSPDGSWFGPLQPLPPTAPPDTKGRVLDFASGYNLNVRPKAYEPITFEQLRSFADSYDLLRLVIETRKDQIAALRWNIGAREGSKVNVEDEAVQTRIQAVKDFFIRPDLENFWDDWLRMILEDLFVLDAPSVFRRRTYGGDLYALEPIDGATIKRVIDNWGRTPKEPGAVAYQQVLKGFPAIDYTAEDLIYRPRNKRTHRIYGYSPVEQIVMTINIGIRRQVWQLQSFTEGNVPEALIGTPATWTPDQIRSFQDWFDGMLEGNTAQRRKAKFVPGEVAKGFVSTKPDEIFGDAEEWLARVICYAFSVSPQALLKMMNRATAETAQETAQLEGLAPIQKWVKGFMDTILIDDFKSPDLEFLWVEEDELDPDKKSQIVDREQAAGRLTFNEARAEQGRDKIDHPDADRPMFKTATGWTPIFLTPEEEAEKAAMAAQIAGQTPPGEEKPGGDGDEAPPGAGSADEGGEPGSEGEDTSEGLEKAAKGVADKSKPPFGEPVPGSYVDVERAKTAKIQKRLKRRVAKMLAKAGKDVAAQIKAALEDPKLGKADEPETPPTGGGGWTVGGVSGLTAEEANVLIDEVLQGLDLEFTADLEDDLVDDLAEVFEDSAHTALGQMGAVSRSELVEQVNERALSWARDYAADMVGTGTSAEYSIGEATRGMLRGTIAEGIEANLSTEDIAKSIQKTYAFSEERAETIAMTEVASANSLGALDGYHEAARMGIKMKKSWLILGDACDVCHGNAGAGKIELEDEFPSGDQAPPAHPHCRCVIVPEVED